MSRPRLIVALDVPNAERALRIAEALQGHADLLKVGLQLFIAQGPGLVRELMSIGWGIFLDLKICDIPATAAGAVRSAAELEVELLTLHTSGGRKMLEAAVAARSKQRVPRLLGVTLLTSLSAEDLPAVGIHDDPASVVDRRCQLAHDSGCDGVVASVREVAAIRARWGPEFLLVTPGIRPAGADAHDQARVATPAAAVLAGADYLVVGRPILHADDPVAAAVAIRASMELPTGAN